MRTVYRLASGKHPLYDGRGAAIAGGRWNEKGVRVIYSAESIALCMVEVMVHTPVHRIKNYVLGRIDIPNGAPLLDFADLNRTVVPVTEFERRAREVIRRVGEPPTSSIYAASDWVRAHALECLEIGRLWVEYPGYLGLLVPSVVARGDYNVLINPEHSDFHRLICHPPEPFEFDKRLAEMQKPDTTA